jgi:hypothetical protein
MSHPPTNLDYVGGVISLWVLLYRVIAACARQVLGAPQLAHQ